ncbi:hypothetical protein [Prevotella sp.]|uniref:hypothetical protein n=1 Tax=Prevotella sp. TaxID=59823 RepID=UPI003AF94B3B
MSVLTVDVVLLELIGAVSVNGEDGLYARAVGSRQSALVGAGNSSQVNVSADRISNAYRIVLRFILSGLLAIARRPSLQQQLLQDT